MLSEIATIFQGAVARTNLVERYAGVVVPMETRVQTESGGFKRESFPVSCTVDGPCSINGNWNKVVPDDALKGLAYVEQRGTATVGRLDSWGYPLTYPVRLVVWLNLASQSFAACADIISQVELSVINCLKQTKTASPSWSDKPIEAEIRNFVIQPKVPSQLFQGYAYNDNQALYFWPYAFTAIDCNITFHIPANCIDAIGTPTPVTCITY